MQPKYRDSPGEQQLCKVNHDTTSDDQAKLQPTLQHSQRSLSPHHQNLHSIAQMHFLVIGASGRTGKLVVNEALSRGHILTALVRDLPSLGVQEGLIIVEGSPLHTADVEKAFMACSPAVPDAAIVTLNSVREADSPFAKHISPPRLMADASNVVVAVLSNHGVKRIVTMSTLGVGDSWARLPTLTKAFMHYTNIKPTLDDHNLVDQEMKKSEMEYTLVRPTRLAYDDVVKPMKTCGSDGKGLGLTASTTTGTAARFLVEVAESGDYKGEAIAISN